MIVVYDDGYIETFPINQCIAQKTYLMRLHRDALVDMGICGFRRSLIEFTDRDGLVFVNAGALGEHVFGDVLRTRFLEQIKSK